MLSFQHRFCELYRGIGIIAVILKYDFHLFGYWYNKMADRLAIWQAIIRKETEFKLERQKIDDEFRNFDLKSKLIDLRIEAAFKIRDDYLVDLRQSYPNIKLDFPQRTIYPSPSISKSEIAIAEILDKNLLDEWDDIGEKGRENENFGRLSLQRLISKQTQSTKGNAENFYCKNKKEDNFAADLQEIKSEMNEILRTLKGNRESEPQTIKYPKIESVDQEQAKTTVSISRRQSFRDREYSAIEHISLPKADTISEEKDQRKMTNNDTGMIPNKTPSSDPSATKIQSPKPLQQHEILVGPSNGSGILAPSYRHSPSPKFSRPRFNFASTPEYETPSPSPKIETKNERDYRETVTSDPTTKNATVESASQPSVDIPGKGVISGDKRKKQEVVIISSSESSTPEAAKSSKVVKTYEALLGVVGSKSEGRKAISSSEDSDDDIHDKIFESKVEEKNSKLVEQEKHEGITIQPIEPKNTEFGKEDRLSDPDDFLAQLFPDKKKNVTQSSTTGPAFPGDRKPKKS
uniref:Uncharacterized protein n=1 Tax=Romanomermis culicivorax TaxID=13658 RepID=A0A915HDK6_ROMCU